MDSVVRIRHDANASTKLLNQFQSQQVLIPLVHEAECDIPQETPQRSQALIDEIVQRVYKVASEWTSSLPPKGLELTYSSSNVSEWLLDRLIETQKGNHIYQSLKNMFGETPAFFEMSTQRFELAGNLLSFFRNKNLISIIHSNEPAFIPTSNPKPTVLSIQAREASLLPYDDRLEKLDLSYSYNIDINRLPIPNSLKTLDLSYTNESKAPENLNKVTTLSMRGNLTELRGFEGLKTLNVFDISYPKSVLRIDQGFWDAIAQRTSTLTIVISPGMSFQVPEDARSKINFEPAKPGQTIRNYGKNVVCEPAQVLEQDSKSKKSKTVLLSNPMNSAGKWLRIARWTGLSLLLAGLGYLAFRLWPRARA
ncbi:MAG: hypothetical protein JSR58_07250 [Verrucomicrobia bacterium]|nr:hypothetical protein [Verrucomicrobiota bacterium]